MPVTRSFKTAADSRKQTRNADRRQGQGSRPAKGHAVVDSPRANGGAVNLSQEPATHLSDKPKGKQRMVDAFPPIQSASTDPALAKVPSGPFLNPFNQSETRLTTLPRESMYYTTPRAVTLAKSKTFLSHLQSDVRDLVSAFVHRYSHKPESSHPLQIFVELWNEKSWDVVHLTWGEDHATREAFFVSTTSMFLRHISDAPLDEDDEITATLKGSAAIFALLLLYETQPRPVKPVPGLKKEAFAWAISEGDTDPLADNDTHKVRVHLETYSALVKWHHKASLSPDLSQDVAFAVRALCGLEPESSHPGSSAFHILPFSETSPAPQAQCKQISLSDKTRGRFGSLVNQRQGTRIQLSRAEALLVRAAQALNVPLSRFAQDEFPTESANGVDNDEWVFEAGEQVTLFESKWIDKPLRPFDGTRLDKFTRVQTGDDSPDGFSSDKCV